MNLTGIAAALAPYTSDNKMWIWIAVAAVGIAVLAVVMFLTRKKK